MIVFDLCLGSIDPDAASEVLLYMAITTLYLCYKTENSSIKLSFEHFLGQCQRLETYVALESHLVPSMEESCVWTQDLHPTLELHCLNSLRFKTNQVSCAQVIYQIVAAFEQDESEEGARPLEKFLTESLYISYVCLLGKYNSQLN